MSFVSDTYATYEISVAADTAIYPLTIDATGGTDLVTNLAPDFRFESAVPSPGTAGIANLNPFTTIAVALARELNGGLDSGNLATAEEIVASQLNCGLDSLASRFVWRCSVVSVPSAAMPVPSGASWLVAVLPQPAARSRRMGMIIDFEIIATHWVPRLQCSNEHWSLGQ